MGHQASSRYREQYLRFFRVNKFREAVGTENEADFPDAEEKVDKLVETKDDDDPKIVVPKRNDISIEHSTMTFTTEAMMGMIYKAQTDKCPGGLAYVVMRLLLQKFIEKSWDSEWIELQ